MKAKEVILGAGVFVAGAAIGVHGIVERTNDRSAAFDKRDTAQASLQLATRSINSTLTWDELPTNKQVELTNTARDFSSAQQELDVLDGEAIVLSQKQLKTVFNGGEILLGLGTVVAVGASAINKFDNNRKRKKYSRKYS